MAKCNFQGKNMQISSREQLLKDVRTHRDSMKQVAEEITYELGLPKEAIYEVLAILYGQDEYMDKAGFLQEDLKGDLEKLVLIVHTRVEYHADCRKKIRETLNKSYLNLHDAPHDHPSLRLHCDLGLPFTRNTAFKRSAGEEFTKKQ